MQGWIGCRNVLWELTFLFFFFFNLNPFVCLPSPHSVDLAWKIPACPSFAVSSCGFLLFFVFFLSLSLQRVALPLPASWLSPSRSCSIPYNSLREHLRGPAARRWSPIYFAGIAAAAARCFDYRLCRDTDKEKLAFFNTPFLLGRNFKVSPKVVFFLWFCFSMMTVNFPQIMLLFFLVQVRRRWSNCPLLTNNPLPLSWKNVMTEGESQSCKIWHQMFAKQKVMRLALFATRSTS